MTREYVACIGIIVSSALLNSCDKKEDISNIPNQRQETSWSREFQSNQYETIHEIEWYNIPYNKKRINQSTLQESKLKNRPEKYSLIQKNIGELNNISEDANCLHFIHKSNKIVGFSFLPIGDPDLDESRRSQISRGLKSTRNVFSIHGKEGTLSSLDPLVSVPSIQILELGDRLLNRKVISDIKKMALEQDLRAISVLHGESLIKAASGTTIPAIKCLIIYIKDGIEVKELTKIFPDLRVLSIIVSKKSSIQEILKKGLLESDHGKLKVIMIAKRYWNTSKYDLEKNDDIGLLLKFNSNKISDNLEYLIMDGTLMNRSDMMAYDSFAIATNLSRRKNGVQDLKVKFFRFGYTSGGATSINAEEFNDLDRFWRD